MFSKLQHYPSVEIRYKAANSINLNYLQQTPSQRQEAPQPVSKNGTRNVQGPNRFKYHRRPLIPYIGALNTQVYYDTARQMSARLAAHQAEKHEPATKTIAIQTMFR